MIHKLGSILQRFLHFYAFLASNIGPLRLYIFGLDNGVENKVGHACITDHRNLRKID